MISRFLVWRRTPKGIWFDWFATLFVSITLAASSFILGWHWTITAGLSAWAALTGAVITLMLSVRNDLGDRLPEAASEPEKENDAPAVVPERRRLA